VTAALRIVSKVSVGLAIEARLFSATEPGVCLWNARRPALVCPASYRSRPGFYNAAASSAARGWPVVTRPTGGGMVPQDASVLNLAMALTVERGFTIEDGFRLVTQPIIVWAALLGPRLEAGSMPDSFCDGDWNLSIAGRKMVGTAQRWRPLSGGKVRILAHGLILAFGGVDAGSVAVNAFHRDMGLRPVRAEAHTTLETATCTSVPSIHRLADVLHAVASREIDANQGTVQVRSAA